MELRRALAGGVWWASRPTAASTSWVARKPLAVAFLALGALGLLVATIFSPMVAAVAVPVAIALLGRVAV